MIPEDQKVPKTKKQLPEFPAEKFTEAVKYLSNGGDISKLRKKYNLTEEIEGKLMEEAI